MLKRFIFCVFQHCSTTIVNKSGGTFEPSNFESIDDLLCTEDEVYDMIISLDTSKANGSNGIFGRILKDMAHSITPILTRLFNMSIESGIFPDKWKLSSVVPIPKGSDHSNLSNY